MIKRGQWRGLRFSGAVTVGNCADLQVADLLAFHLADPHTRAIGCYVEDIKDGRALFELMRDGATRKPVVLLRGGASKPGTHRGAIAHRRARRRQSGVERARRADALRRSRHARRVRRHAAGAAAPDLAAAATDPPGDDVRQRRRVERARRRLLRAPRPRRVAVRAGRAGAARYDRSAARHQPVEPDRHAGRHPAGERRGDPPANPRHRLCARRARRDRPAPQHVVVLRARRRRSDRQHLRLHRGGDGGAPGRRARAGRLPHRRRPGAGGAQARLPGNGAAARHPDVRDEIPEMAKALAAVAHLERRLAASS